MTAVTGRLTTALAGRYRLDRHLGEGGMATVYLAQDLKHDRRVALKVLKPELAAILGAERFLNEIKLTANLQHPNILPLYDSGEADTFLYYVMPFVEGESLRERMNREHQMGVEDAVEITKGCAAALQYAHERRIVHRDIKPENILLQSGQPLVADFGIALAVTQAGGTRLTQTGLSLGTPAYMSPEQATGDRELDARSDIYSLGSVLYEMLVGEPPHVGNSVQAIIARILSERPAPITQSRDLVPPHIDAAVQKALAKSPADRFRSAAEFVGALTNTSFTLPPRSGPVVAERTRRWQDRALVPLVGLVVVLLATTAWGWVRPRNTATPVVTRFPILLPDSAPLSQQFGTLFALTDDGSSIVYAGPGENDINLWVRPLNSLSATVIPGTSGADSPFLSPDGDEVAFYRNGPRGLYTVSLRGGPRLTLVQDSTVALGGDWGPDGSIYFVRTGGIRRYVPFDKRVELVTQVDTAQGEAAHAWVDVLPSGRTALFTIERGESSQYDIAAVNLRTGDVKTLLRGVYARYAASGHIVYANADGGLFAIPFDERAMATRGTAIPLVAGVQVTERGAAHFTLSGNGTLLYGTGGATSTHQVQWVDRAGRPQIVDSTLKGPFYDLALSPDGRQLAITVVNGRNGEVWIKELDRGPMGKRSSENLVNYGPAWSADGRNVTYIARGGSTTASTTRVISRRADGSGGENVLLNVNGPLDYAFVTRDGQWIVYQTSPPGFSTLVAKRVGGDTATVTLASGSRSFLAPRVSPDGRWLAYVSLETGQAEVYVSPFPDVSTSRTQISLSGGSEPLWARAGLELFFQDDRTNLVAARLSAAPSLRVIDRTVLFNRASYNRDATAGPMYDVTPDGKRFIMTLTRGETSERLVMVLNLFAELERPRGR